MAAAVATASGLGLVVGDAVVLNDSNRLVAHLGPCDVVARVTPPSHHAGHGASPRREVVLVDQLARVGGPVAGLDPRVAPHVIVHDGFEISLWAFHEPVDRGLSPAEYARTLADLHAGLRMVEVEAPHVLDRVTAVQRDVASPGVTPDLAEVDRALLAGVLHDLRRSVAEREATEQLLHGEPHPWNVLVTAGGPLFIDFENAARGPVEYDLAWVPQEVGARVADADQDLVGACRGLVLAMVAAYRWRRDDEHPSGRRSGLAFLDAVRAGPPWAALDEVTCC